MFLKSFALLGAATVGGAWAFGAFDEYPRTVEGSPETIMAELADLDIRELPGSPGTDAAAAGGVKPRFQLERGENRMDWFVMSGSQVATRMTAFLEPVDGGTNTRITYEIERGDAPDEMTSPAFRSESMTGSLFQLALNTEIDEINAPGWGPECDAIAQNIMGGVVGIGDPEAMANWEEKGDPADRIKQVGKVALKLGMRVRKCWLPVAIPTLRMRRAVGLMVLSGSPPPWVRAPANGAMMAVQSPIPMPISKKGAASRKSKQIGARANRRMFGG